MSPATPTGEGYTQLIVYLTSPNGVGASSANGPWIKTNISTDPNGKATVTFDVPTYSGYWYVVVDFGSHYYANYSMLYLGGTWQTGFTVSPIKTPTPSTIATPTASPIPTDNPTPTPTVPEFTVIAFFAFVCSNAIYCDKAKASKNSQRINPNLEEKLDKHNFIQMVLRKRGNAGYVSSALILWRALFFFPCFEFLTFIAKYRVFWSLFSCIVTS
jgi:hypothetical protein